MKLDEFMDFREKMNNSMHYTTMVVDRIILSLVDCSRIDSLYNLDISPRDNKIEWDKLRQRVYYFYLVDDVVWILIDRLMIILFIIFRDNRDLKVFVTWDPEFASKSVEESDEIKQLYRQDLKFLKLRTHILWSLSAAIEVITY